MRLIVTRPREQGRAWVQRLQGLGVDAEALPLIEIAPVADAAPLQQAWARLPQTAFVMFVSANAVQQFFRHRPEGAVWPEALRAGATGPGTVQALVAADVPRDLIDAPAADAPRWDSEALWAQIGSRPWAGRAVLVVRGEDGRDWLAEQWQARGAALGFVAAYRRLPPQWRDDEQALWQGILAAPGQDLWHFSASEALRNLVGVSGAPSDWRAWPALVTHERMLASAQAAGFAPLRCVAPTLEAAREAWARSAGATGRFVQSRAP